MPERKGLTLVFVPYDEILGEESDPLEEILREYTIQTGKILLQYDEDKRDWMDNHVSAAQNELLKVHMKAMKDIMALGFTGKQASEMLGRPTVEHPR